MSKEMWLFWLDLCDSSTQILLAAWFRLKHPHIAIGAVASSAPIYSFKSPPKDDFCTVVTRAFEHTNKRCADLIRQSWSVMDDIGSSSDGLHVLTKMFNLYSPLRSTFELKRYLAHFYASTAQINRDNNLIIKNICDTIVKAPNNDTLKGIASATHIDINDSCVDLSILVDQMSLNDMGRSALKAWNWQDLGGYI